ncbi:MAG TPA: hypothetical protein PK669_05205, partial [Methanosarcina thermophila]|nr:hypothetical protein [Methanosarcina thermophila]HOQ66399.1 hypothetical protein [Methanosarcina thermophila]HQD94086.1 hypothetical protein [Methanosarcina thermophila]
MTLCDGNLSEKFLAAYNQIFRGISPENSGFSRDFSHYNSASRHYRSLPANIADRRRGSYILRTI